MQKTKMFSLSSMFSSLEQEKIQSYQHPHVDNRITSFAYEELVLKRLLPFSNQKKINDKSYQEKNIDLLENSFFYSYQENENIESNNIDYLLISYPAKD